MFNHYKLPHHDYARLLRRCADIADEFRCRDTTDLYIELGQVKFDYNNLYFEVPEDLMSRIAVACMCEMSLTQYRDSYGEIDYAALGDFSETVLESTIRNINSMCYYMK